MIYVNDKLRDGMGAFSHKFRLIAEMIEGGVQWLRFAMDSPGDAFVAKTEAELLALVQQGLHDSPHVALPRLGLLVNPMKLWSLPEDALALLGAARKEESVADVLAEQALADFDALDLGADYAERLGVAKAACFRVMNLSDRLALLGLALESEPVEEQKAARTQLRREAAEFGVRDAQNAREFADRHRFYLAVQEKFASRSKNARRQRAEIAWEDYNGLCGEWMETITLGPGYDSADLSLAVKDALAGGGRLGFTTKASAMHNLMANTALKCQMPAEASGMAAQYMTNAVSFIESGKVENKQVFQDGVLRLNFMSALWPAGDAVRVHVNRRGVVTLNWAAVKKPL